MGGRVLVVAAHPDDDVRGRGATIARRVREGRQVLVALVTDGVEARSDADPAPAERRQAATEPAAAILGVVDPSFAVWPENRLDHIPVMVLTRHAGDLNIDHRRVSQAVVTACRPQPGDPVRSLWPFEVASTTKRPIRTQAWCPFQRRSATCAHISNGNSRRSAPTGRSSTSGPTPVHGGPLRSSRNGEVRALGPRLPGHSSSCGC